MFENDDSFNTGKMLLIDGDIPLYKLCCIFNEDTDWAKAQIVRQLFNQVTDAVRDADCDDYIFFVTTKYNFRNDLVCDYKLKRSEQDRPVNLGWVKEWAVLNLAAKYHKGLEADDLLGIHQTDKTVIWSADKDLRQIPGLHLDDATREVKTITEEGSIKHLGKSKYYFEGLAGFYFQCLTGDSTDYIVGCGKRVGKVYGPKAAKAGEKYVARQGVGAGAAFKLLNGLTPKAQLAVVRMQYQKIHGADWQQHLETQANLLFMVRNLEGETIQRWTYDGREEYFDLVKGVVIHEADSAG